VCSGDDNDEDTLRVDWDWGTVRYRMSNYNPAQPHPAPARTPSAAGSASSDPPGRGGGQRAAAGPSHAAAGPGRTEPVNGVAMHVNRHGKQPSSHLQQQQQQLTVSLCSLVHSWSGWPNWLLLIAV